LTVFIHETIVFLSLPNLLPSLETRPVKKHSDTGQKCFVCLTRVVGRNAAVKAEMGVTIGFTCESFSRKAFELIWQEQET
jgi:hypothetical protein